MGSLSTMRVLGFGLRSSGLVASALYPLSHLTGSLLGIVFFSWKEWTKRSCSPGWPQTCHGTEADPPASAQSPRPPGRGLQVCVTKLVSVTDCSSANLCSDTAQVATGSIYTDTWCVGGTYLFPKEVVLSSSNEPAKERGIQAGGRCRMGYACDPQNQRGRGWKIDAALGVAWAT